MPEANGLRTKLPSVRPHTTDSAPTESQDTNFDSRTRSAGLGTAESQNGWVPAELWGNVVANRNPVAAQQIWGQPDDLDRSGSSSGSNMPFRRSNQRQFFAGTARRMLEKGSSRPLLPRSSSVPPHLMKTALHSVFEETDPPTTRPEPAPTRADAQVLTQTYSEMMASIRENYGGLDVEAMAKEAAQAADPDRVVSLLEPKIYVIDVVMAELVKQVRVGCVERGELLERCRQHFLSMFSISALAMGVVDTRFREQQEHAAALDEKVGPLERECELAVSKIAAMDMDLKTAQATVAGVEEELETTKRSMTKTKELEERSRSQKEQALIGKLEEAEAINNILKSKLAVMQAQVKHAEANNGTLQAQVQELQERVRRDAEHLEVLSENVARSKVRLAWMRALVFLKRQKKEKKDVNIQAGESMLPPPLTDTLDRLGSGGALADGVDGEAGAASPEGAKKKRGLLGAKAQMPAGNQAIPFERFWTTVMKVAEGIDFHHSPQLQMTKRSLLDFISRIYTEKILVDEVDDRARLSRQSLPEFLYDYHLELLGEPQLAEEALINIVANLNQHLHASPRVRMFSRFLGMAKQPPLGVDALNMYLVGLVKVQKGQIPLLPDFDNMHVDFGRAIKVVEFVFTQAPYVVKTKILLECEKRAVGRQIDLDSFLLFLVDMWREEQARSEERLRALFVASDTDGNGNLDFQEFHDMVKHINSSKTHRELLRMYGEMTLNRVVDSNTFVRVCRKFKFFALDLGPSVKRQDNSAAEVFDLLNTEWGKIEDYVHELLVVLEGVAVGKRLEQDVNTLKKMLTDRIEPEQAWVCYRKVVAECTSAVKNRTPSVQEPPPTKPAKGKAAKAKDS